jgi:hypothetical protein
VGAPPAAAHSRRRRGRSGAAGQGLLFAGEREAGCVRAGWRGSSEARRACARRSQALIESPTARRARSGEQLLVGLGVQRERKGRDEMEGCGSRPHSGTAAAAGASPCGPAASPALPPTKQRPPGQRRVASVEAEHSRPKALRRRVSGMAPRAAERSQGPICSADSSRSANQQGSLPGGRAESNGTGARSERGRRLHGESARLRHWPLS